MKGLPAGSPFVVERGAGAGARRGIIDLAQSIV